MGYEMRKRTMWLGIMRRGISAWGTIYQPGAPYISHGHHISAWGPYISRGHHISAWGTIYQPGAPYISLGCHISAWGTIYQPNGAHISAWVPAHSDHRAWVLIFWLCWCDKQSCQNTMPDLSDLVIFPSGQVRNSYSLVLGQV